MAKAKKENKELVSKAQTAIEISGEIKAIVDSIIEAGGECSDETLEALKSLNMALEQKAENIGFVKTRLESEMEYFKAIEEAAKAQRKARELALERMKKHLLFCMQQAGVKSIKKNDGLFSFSLVEGRIRTVIEDKELLPYEYTDVVEVINPKTDAIKSALEAGQEVSGAHLERGEDYVMIRGGKNNA